METHHPIKVSLTDIRRRLQTIEALLGELSPKKPAWIDQDEICTQLHITKRTLSRYRERGFLAYSKFGGRIYFQQSDIDDWLENHSVRMEELS